MPKTPFDYRPLGRSARQKAEDAETRHLVEKLQDQRDALAVITIVFMSVLICAIVASISYFAFARS
jgi:hypothetical protein